MNTIQESFYNESQSWYYVWTLSTEGVKLRVRIRRNAYDEQSFGVAEVWTDAGWADVIRVPITDLACAGISYTKRDAPKATFVADARSLVSMALEVLS